MHSIIDSRLNEELVLCINRLEQDDHVLAVIRRPQPDPVNQHVFPLDNPELLLDDDASAIFVSALVDFTANHDHRSKRRHASAKASIGGDNTSNHIIRTPSINRYQSIPRSNANRRMQWTEIEPSAFARDTINPIRRLVDVMSVDPNPEKPLLKLHIGDPSITGILPTHPNILKAVTDALQTGRYNGYGPAIGFAEIRRQLADYLNTTNGNERPVNGDEIILTSGCSHALQLAIEALAGPGQNILVPRPGFPLYTTLMQPHGVESRFYNLLIDRDWEADLIQMESLIDNRTAAIVINNPNNPTGAVYSKRHLEQLLKLADKHRLPIIADEIYGDMVYGGGQFYPIYTLKPKVPVLTCDGISKRYLVPGWRLGWLIIHDLDGALKSVRQAAQQLSQKIVGPCSLMQGALPAILHQTPLDFFHYNRKIFSENVDIVCDELKNAPGLTPIKAQGAMYIMIAVDPLVFPEFMRKSPLDPVAAMVKQLISEESLYCLPGSAFNYPNALRLVTTFKFETTRMACKRMKEFCTRHYQGKESKTVDL